MQFIISYCLHRAQIYDSCEPKLVLETYEIYPIKNLCHENIYISKAREFLFEEKKTLNQKFYFGHKVKIINKLKYRNGMR